MFITALPTEIFKNYFQDWSEEKMFYSNIVDKSKLKLK